MEEHLNAFARAFPGQSSRTSLLRFKVPQLALWNTKR